MTAHYIADASVLAVGAMKAFDIAGERVLLVRLADGFVATQAKCPHLFMPLEKGDIIDGKNIRCKFHRAEFDAKTGKTCKWANFPPGIQALNFVRGEKDLRTFPVKVDGGKVYVEL